jgi:hypothetical protein
MKYVLAIDPSLHNCGYAVFKGKKLIKYGLLKLDKEKNWIQRARNVVAGIQNEIDELGWDIQLVTEIPQGFGSTDKGFLARESGSERKLAFLCGMIYNMTPNTIEYEPRQWKGQLPKCVVRARLSKLKQYKNLPLYRSKVVECRDCKRRHLDHDLDHNILDAIAIGHFYLYGEI